MDKTARRKQQQDAQDQKRQRVQQARWAVLEQVRKIYLGQ